MADEADIAFDFTEGYLSHALANQRKSERRLKPVGCCHNCGNTENLATPLFCDTDCGTDWERHETLLRKQGLPMTSMAFNAVAVSTPTRVLANA